MNSTVLWLGESAFRVSDTDIDAAYYELAACTGGEPAVAVRSSALDEDGASDSFAGQHDTFLNVRGLAELHAAIERCNRPSVSDAQCIDAVRMAITLEDEMGWPVDVECAWQDGTCYLLQCRPITTLPNASGKH